MSAFIPLDMSAASLDSRDWIQSLFHDELGGETTMDRYHEIMADNMMAMSEPIYEWGPDPDLTKDHDFLMERSSTTVSSSSPKRRRTRKTAAAASSSSKKTKKRAVVVATYTVLRTPLSFFWSMGKV